MSETGSQSRLGVGGRSLAGTRTPRPRCRLPAFLPSLRQSVPLLVLGCLDAASVALPASFTSAVMQPLAAPAGREAARATIQISR